MQNTILNKKKLCFCLGALLFTVSCSPTSVTFSEAVVEGAQFSSQESSVNSQSSSVNSSASSATSVSSSSSVSSATYQSVVGQWQNIALPSHNKNFNLRFNISASGNLIDATTGLSQSQVGLLASPSANYSQLSPQFRFFTDGKVQAYNAGFVASSFNYQGNVSYRVDISINVDLQKYSLLITPNGAASVLIANNFAFRAAAQNINYLNIIATTASHSVSNLVTSAYFDLGSSSTSSSSSQSSMSSQSSSVPPIILESNFVKAKRVLDANCISCHSAGGKAANINFNYSNQADFFDPNKAGVWFKAGDAQSSVLLRMRGSGSSLPVMPPIPTMISDADIDLIKTWVLNAPKPGDVGGGTPTTPFFDVPDPIDCQSPSDVAASDNGRLTKTQLVNTLQMLFSVEATNAVLTAINNLQNDGSPSQFEGFRSVVSEQQANAYADIAIGVADYVYNNTTQRGKVFGTATCVGANARTVACVDTYLSNYATQVFRRPLTAGEKTLSKVVYESGDTAKESFVRVLAYHLMHPGFLVRMEIGGSTTATLADPDQLFRISSYELASRISFLITNRGPDSELLQTAANGTLSQEAVLRTQVARLMNTSLARAKFRELGTYWLGKSFSPSFSGLPADYLNGLQTANLGEAAVTESEKFMEHMIWDGSSKYSDLLTSKVSFASHAGLASIYGHTPYVSGTPSTLGGTRKGLFGRLPFLYSQATRNSLILRSVQFRERVLCDEIPSPSADVFAARDRNIVNDAIAHTLTTRQMVAKITENVSGSSVSCMSCHASINPLGNVFEGYDSLGRSRTVEKIYTNAGALVRSVAVDTVDYVPVWGNTEIVAANSSEFLDAISNSARAKACFSKKLLAYSNSRVFTEQDSCQLKAADDVLRVNNGTLKDAIISILSHEALRWKRVRSE